jgi:hypothetical protein
MTEQTGAHENCEFTTHGYFRQVYGTLLYNVNDDPKQDRPLGPESIEVSASAPVHQTLLAKKHFDSHFCCHESARSRTRQHADAGPPWSSRIPAAVHRVPESNRP